MTSRIERHFQIKSSKIKRRSQKIKIWPQKANLTSKIKFSPQDFFDLKLKRKQLLTSKFSSRKAKFVLKKQFWPHKPNFDVGHQILRYISYFHLKNTNFRIKNKFSLRQTKKLLKNWMNLSHILMTLLGNGISYLYVI